MQAFTEPVKVTLVDLPELQAKPFHILPWKCLNRQLQRGTGKGPRCDQGEPVLARLMAERQRGGRGNSELVSERKSLRMGWEHPADTRK